MKFPVPLIRGRLIQRYKRFLADIELANGEAITAHCANPGSMIGLAIPGATVWLSHATNPAAKLDYKWELVEADGTLVNINTSHPNAVAAEAIASGIIAELAGYTSIRREVRYGANSRVDLLLENGPAKPPCYVEVKSVTLRLGDAAEFPDAVTARGTKHLHELKAMANQGARAMMLFIAGRDDCRFFSIAGDIDPAYEQAFRDAREAGVEAVCYAARVTPESITVDHPLHVMA